MATFTVRPEGIIRQPALTMPGNATGSEAACTSLTASQIRTLLSLGTTSDVTFDIVRATTSVLSPLFKNGSAVTTLGDVTYGVSIPGTSSFGVNQWINSSEGSNRILFAPASHTYFDSPGQFLFRNAGGATYGTINAATLDHPTAALTLGNATYGVTVPGAATFSGDIKLSSAQRIRWGGVVDNNSPSIEGSYATGYVTIRTNGGLVSISNFGGITASASSSISASSYNVLNLTGSDGSLSCIVLANSSSSTTYRIGVVGSATYTGLAAGAFTIGEGETLRLAMTSTGATFPNNLSYAGGFSTGTATKSANYTTTASDYCVNVTANSIDITFETAVGCANREHEVINSGSGTVTLKTTSAQTISGSASGALTLAQWKSIRVKSDGANWLIMSQIT